MLDHSCQVQRHALSERRDDLYETPAVAVEALLRHERLPHRIWEPACGRGAIVNVLRAHDHEVVATDLVDYGIPITAPGYYRVDFLMERCAPEGTQAIVTNPPFKLAEQFVEHALDLCPRVVMLLRLAFLESNRRTAILENRGLARIHVFRKRLPMMHTRRPCLCLLLGPAIRPCLSLAVKPKDAPVPDKSKPLADALDVSISF